MTEKITIMWFRQDLRVRDNPALNAAVERKGKILPVYILDDDNSGEWKMGGASRVWLHHALNDLSESLNGHLQVFNGNPKDILQGLIEEHDVDSIYWNRCYEGWRIERDKDIKSHFSDQNIEVESCNGSLLWEPWQIKNQQGAMYKVFTPFYRKGCLNEPEPREPLNKPQYISCVQHENSKKKIDELSLLPETLDWHKPIESEWDMSEEGAHNRLQDFLDEGLNNYKEGRNFPDKDNVSRLSPYLHFGQISPHTVWHNARQYSISNGLEKDMDHFCSELGWREFSYSLLYHVPDFPRKNWQEKFDHFPWDKNDKALTAWQKGQTGYPIVDAGMRELWYTGYMHNRVRMIVGSFLVKNLMLHWHHGEEWFWDCLVDADLANNSASWQWIAGCGADAAPYFRIFNPLTQGQKFDPDGNYIRRWVPELEKMPDKHLNAPWDAPENVLEYAGVELGKDYPKPIIDLKASRERALEAFKSLS